MQDQQVHIIYCTASPGDASETTTTLNHHKDDGFTTIHSQSLVNLLIYTWAVLDEKCLHVKPSMMSSIPFSKPPKNATSLWCYMLPKHLMQIVLVRGMLIRRQSRRGHTVTCCLFTVVEGPPLHIGSSRWVQLGQVLVREMPWISHHGEKFWGRSNQANSDLLFELKFEILPGPVKIRERERERDVRLKQDK